MNSIIDNIKINIVFTPIPYSDGMAGSTRLFGLVKVLKNNNITCNNIILTKKRSENVDSNVNSTQVYTRETIFSPISQFYYFAKALLYFKKNKKKNILYKYGYPNIQNIWYILLAKLFGYKVLFDIVEDNSLINNFKSLIAKIRIKSSLLFIRYIYLFADGVVVISNHLYDKIYAINKKKKFPIILIPITIDKNDYLSHNISSNNEIKIFYGGSFGIKDGLEYLIRAFEIVCEKNDLCKLIITGKGSDRDFKTFQNIYKSSKFKDRIFYKGFLDRESYLKELLSASIHCMTRVNTEFANAGFPFKLGEMLASGIPVVCSTVGDVEKYIQNHRDALLIEPQNELQIADAILYLIENKDERVRIGFNGKLCAETNFDSYLHTKRLTDFLINKL